MQSSVGTLMLVPDGMPGAGRLKIASFDTGWWYDATIAADGAGTFEITVNSAVSVHIGNTPQGIVYVPAGSPLFDAASILVTEHNGGNVAAYEVDSNGDPIPATRRTFMTGLSGAQGAAIDPVTGDFLFSTYGGGNQIVRVSLAGVPAVPEPGTWVLLAFGLGVLAMASLG